MIGYSCRLWRMEKKKKRKKKKEMLATRENYDWNWWLNFNKRLCNGTRTTCFRAAYWYSYQYHIILIMPRFIFHGFLYRSTFDVRQFFNLSIFFGYNITLEIWFFFIKNLKIFLQFDALRTWKRWFWIIK